MHRNPNWRAPELGWYALPPCCPAEGRVRVTGVTHLGGVRFIYLEWDACSRSTGELIRDCRPMSWEKWAAIWSGAATPEPPSTADETTQPMKVG